MKSNNSNSSSNSNSNHKRSGSSSNNGTYQLPKPIVEVPLDKQIDEIFKRKLSDLPVYKDLPRLVGRIFIENYSPPPIDSNTGSVTSTSVIDGSIPPKKRKSKALSLKLSKDFGEIAGKDNEDKLQVENDNTPTTTPTPTPESNDLKIWKNVKSIIFKLSELYENQETISKVKSTFENTTMPSDYQLSLPSLFESCMDESTSKVIKILKLIHQNIIYIGCYELKLRVPYLMVNLTKDVRGPEGWIINVFKGKDTSTVTHIRREESMDKKFCFEWQLHITLSKDLTEVSYASLKITNLIFDQSASREFKEEVSRSLCNGNLFVM